MLGSLFVLFALAAAVFVGLLSVVLATLAFAALVVVGILVGVVVLPLVPLLAVAAFVWLLLKASASPATL
jgi:hypothetical protein